MNLMKIFLVGLVALAMIGLLGVVVMDIVGDDAPTEIELPEDYGPLEPMASSEGQAVTVYLMTDPATGCEYLVSSCGGIQPRLNAPGGWVRCFEGGRRRDR